MANLTAAIRRIRHTRQELDTPSLRFDRYRSDYERILEAIAAVGGDPAFDALVAWMTDSTKQQGQLPSPADTRRQARAICAERGLSIPEDSPLRD